MRRLRCFCEPPTPSISSGALESPEALEALERARWRQRSWRPWQGYHAGVDWNIPGALVNFRVRKRAPKGRAGAGDLRFGSRLKQISQLQSYCVAEETPCPRCSENASSNSSYMDSGWRGSRPSQPPPAVSTVVSLPSSNRSSTHGRMRNGHALEDRQEQRGWLGAHLQRQNKTQVSCFA